MQWSLERAAERGSIHVTKSGRHFPARNGRFTLISRGKETALYHLCPAIQRGGRVKGGGRRLHTRLPSPPLSEPFAESQATGGRVDRGERWRDVREKLEVGPVIVSALILDQFTGCTRTPEPSVSSSETPPSCCHTGGGAATGAPTRTAMERGVFIQTRTET